MTPRNNLVLIKIIKRPETVVGQIIVPKTANQDYELAEVVAVGRGHLQADGTCQGTEDLTPGTRVIVKTSQQVRNLAGGVARARTALPFKVGDDEVELVNEQDIVANCDA